jgi:hypothetical protein
MTDNIDLPEKRRSGKGRRTSLDDGTTSQIESHNSESANNPIVIEDDTLADEEQPVVDSSIYHYQ